MYNLLLNVYDCIYNFIKYIFSYSLALNFLSKKLAKSVIAEDVPFLFSKGESSYKYVDLDVNDEELYSN